MNIQEIKQANGFTLIELLVVVLIIGILAAVALPHYRITVEKAHAMEAIANVKAIAQAQKIYFLEHGTYATDIQDLDISKNAAFSYWESNTYNWYISLSTARSEYPRVYAGRDGQGQKYNNGRWYIIYELTNDTFYCATGATDTSSQKICNTFSTSRSKCLSDPALWCYPLKGS